MRNSTHYLKGVGRLSAIAAVLLLSAGAALSAQTSGFGAGLVLGEPTGLAAKLWLSKEDALDFTAAWSFYRNAGDGKDNDGALYFHADYLRHFTGVVDVDVKRGELLPYAGLGGKAALGGDFYLGVRVPLGLVYAFEKVPLDAFLEIAPAFILVPETGFDVGGGIGLRYWFD